MLGNLSNIKFYLTSSEPGVEQTLHSQSIGGYPAIVLDEPNKSLVYPVAGAHQKNNTDTFIKGFDIYDRNDLLAVSDQSIGSVTNFVGKKYIAVGHEIIEITPPTSVVSGTPNYINMSVVSKSVNGLVFTLSNPEMTTVSTKPIYALTSDLFFDDSFNKSMKQYRCFAIKNTAALSATSQWLYNLRIYLKQNSRNEKSKIKFALEIPSSDYFTSTSDSGSKSTIVDSALLSYSDNYFKDAYVRIKSGDNEDQERTVISFDRATSTIVVDTAFPSVITSGITYEIDPAPAQRLSSGINKPSDNGRISEFKDYSIDNPLFIDMFSDRLGGKHLRGGDVVYVWMEREVKENESVFENNNCVISMTYDKGGS